jgi:hypothetical protein
MKIIDYQIDNQISDSDLLAEFLASSNNDTLKEVLKNLSDEYGEKE